MNETIPANRRVLRLLDRLGLAPEIVPTPQEAATIWLVGFAVAFNHYGEAIYGLALPRLQESLGIAEAEVGRYSSLFALAVVPAVALAYLADLIGRRRLLVLTLTLSASLNFASAFARSAFEFYALQVGSRIFGVAEDMLAAVVIVEALRPALRGWGIGALAALAATGHGWAAGVYAFVGLLPYDWRALYLIGALPMFLIAWLRRNLRETDHFLAHRSAREASGASGFDLALAPLRALFRAYPGRLAAVAAALIPFAIGVAPALGLMPKLLQDTRGYSESEVSMLFLFGGAFAVAGNFAAGRIADRIGRKKVLVVTGLVSTLAGLVGYEIERGPLLVALWIVALFTFFSASVSFSALSGEIFPTSYRSTASALRGLLGAAGAGLGLYLESSLYGVFGNHNDAIQVLLLVAPLGLAVVLFGLPETAGLELDEIAPEVSLASKSGSATTPAS